MAIGIGIDIGSVSIKAAVVATKNEEALLKFLSEKEGFSLFESNNSSDFIIVLSHYRRIKGNPLNAVEDILNSVLDVFDDNKICLAVTGSGGKLAGKRYNVPVINEFSAIVDAINLLHPDVRTIFEMGGETSKYILLDNNSDSQKLSIVDYGTNGDCAAGTGAFMDQQASRLQYKVEDIGDIVINAGKAAQIAGRCSVFAKSDMIHSQQRGYRPDEVLKGLCNAVTRNFKSAINRGKKVVTPVLFIGGVSINAGIRQSLREVFGIDSRDLTVPETMCWLGAIGTAKKALEEKVLLKYSQSNKLFIHDKYPCMKKLSLDNVVLLREEITPFSFNDSKERIPVYVGIDVGSVSTNIVVIDTEGRVIKEIYTRTNARPIEVVGEGLKEIEKEIGRRIDVIGVGATGSGRELTGILIGADTINDEITAHKTGALHISRTMLNKEVDTIFEIGGQDSKYISIEDGIVVDFTMNDACAAGTGSFLEEQAEELDIKIIDEFAQNALSSEKPIRLGERCTVFMGRDVNSYMQKGADKKDVIAGLAYSVVQNYLNRVVRDRKIGDNIFFQGGTAYNDSVAAAFAIITGKEIIVPPYNGVIGAIGVALLAKRKMETTKAKCIFRGFDISKIDYKLKEFTCKGCSNFCTVQEFNVDGEKTYWGDKCSERYRKRKKVEKTPVIEDLFKIREELLQKTFAENGNSGPVVGIPLTMDTYDRLPFYNTYLAGCGFSTLLSEPSNTSIANMGIESVVSEPCYPIIMAHGHIKSLLEKGVEFIWIPNVINSETEIQEKESFSCVWGMTLPFVAEHSPAFHSQRHKILKPTLHFREGKKIVKKEFYEFFNKFGISRKVSDNAIEKAYKSQIDFKLNLLKAGEQAIDKVNRAGERAIILLGRPYNIYDKMINISVASKLAGIYGINVIPLDFINIDGITINEINSNMYWNYGKIILQVAKKLSGESKFDFIYITNFKCGPDSFIKQYIRDAIRRPFLVLQFDGHSNDAGMMTRCEAYLDSKGFLSIQGG